MTYIVNESCIKCKLMDCVEVCPVDCFYEGENMLVIHPDECIDCGVCEPECPVEAIKPDTESGAEKWLKLNADYAKTWPNITVKKAPPADSKEWRTSRTNSNTSRRIPARVIEAPIISNRRGRCLAPIYRLSRVVCTGRGRGNIQAGAYICAEKERAFMSEERDDQERPCLHCMIVELIMIFLLSIPKTPASRTQSILMK